MKKIKEIMATLKKRGYFKNPDEVEKYFEASLWEVYFDGVKEGANEALNIIAQNEGWEESEDLYREKLKTLIIKK